MNYLLRQRELNISSAALRVRGPDANTYLQGQFTQELRIRVGQSAYGLWLDQKGRVLADSQVLKQGENDYLIVSFSSGGDALRARLEAYLIADEVELTDETAAWESVLWWGNDLATLREPSQWSWPSRRAGPGSREWLLPKGAGDAAVAESGVKACEADMLLTEQARLRAGWPAVPVDIGLRDLANEGGLEELAISYTKGCYLGQEVMARLKNLGQVRRRLHLVRGKGAPPAVGTALFQGERKVGETRSAVAEGEGFLALAMLSLVTLDPQAGLALVAQGTPDVTLVQRV